MTKIKKSAILLVTLLFIGNFDKFLQAAEFKISGNYRLNDYLYDEQTRFTGPLYERSTYILQQATLNTSVKEGITTGVVQLFLNSLANGNQPEGGYIWGSNGGYSSNLQTGPLVHQAYLDMQTPIGNLYAGRRLIKLGHGIILNDTADNIAFHLPVGFIEFDLAYLKLQEPDSVNYGNNDDYDRNGMIFNINLKLNETDSMGFFYASENQRATGLMIDDTHVLAVGFSGDARIAGIDWSAEFDTLSGFDGDFRVNLPRAGMNIFMSGSMPVRFGRVGLDILRIRGNTLGETPFNSLAGDFVGGNGILLNDQTRFGGGIDLNHGMADMADPSGYLSLLSHNFQSVKGSITLNPIKKLIIGMEFFPFVTVIDRGVLGLTNEKIGMEVNLTGTYPIIGDFFKVSGGVAYFKAGDAMQEIAAKTGISSVADNVIKSRLSLLYTF